MKDKDMSRYNENLHVHSYGLLYNGHIQLYIREVFRQLEDGGLFVSGRFIP